MKKLITHILCAAVVVAITLTIAACSAAEQLLTIAETPTDAPGSAPTAAPGPAPTDAPSPSNGAEPTPDPEPMPTPPPTNEPTPTPDPTPAPTPAPPPEEKILAISETHPELMAELDALSLLHDCVAVSFAAYDGDANEYFVYQYGYAEKREERLVDTGTKFRIASLAKLPAAICAMTLVDEGRLDLDEDISTYLGYKVRNPNFPDTPITSRMLMQHTSSILDSDTFEWSRAGNSSQPMQSLLKAESSFKNRRPGASYAYTNFGISVLAAVCENIYGKTFDLFAREVLFAPMGIDAAYVAQRLDDTENIAAMYNSEHSLRRSVQAQLDIGDSADSGMLGHDHHIAQGNLTISAVDYARILAMLGNGGCAIGGERIISEEAAKAINDANSPSGSYKLGLVTRYSAVPYMPGGEAFWHTGSAYGVFSQYVYSADGTNRGLVLITTGSLGTKAGGGKLVVATDMFSVAWQELWE